MKAARLAAVVVVLGLAAGAYLYLRQAPAGVRGPRPELAGPRAVPAEIPRAGTPAEVKSENGAPVDQPSELVAKLNAPDGDINADLRIVDSVFAAYRAGTKEDDPVGENAEITAALMGKNKLDFAFVPKDSPALNAKGELCDRWGTPFFFHQLAGDSMEIRSAGPDKKLWTADDVVLSPE
jgi:hypothetical protein